MPVTETNAGAAASPAAVPAADTVLNTVNPPDKHIWGIYIALCALSIIELYSASSREIAASASTIRLYATWHSSP